MKKIFTLLVAIATCLSAMAATFSFTDEASCNQTVEGYTVRIEKGSGNNPPAIYNGSLRLYAGNTITVSGSDITNIKLTFTKQGQKDYASLTANSGSLISGGVSTSNTNPVTDVWTGSTNSVTFTIGTGQRIITRIVVNGTDGEGDDSGNTGGDDNPGNNDDTSDLNPDFLYPEPTLVLVPSKTVQGDEYSFISNNIKVDCTKGAVTDSYFSAHAGFAMTFTATRPIKGLVINGFVKKGFEATASSGKIDYLSPSDDAEANPVLVITDINSTSITIDCVKQLRCYNVEVYFEENPEATVSGGSSGGQQFDLTYDSAEAVYESVYSEALGELNYSIFLFNASSPDLPYFALDIYPESKDDLTGTYSWDDWTLGDYCYYVWGEGDDDITWVDDGSVTIVKKGDIYTISGSLVCDNNNTYNISFTGEIPIYLDTDYYGDGDDDTSGVKVTVNEPEFKGDAQMFDLQGRKVNKNFRGIYILNGKKHVNR